MQAVLRSKRSGPEPSPAEARANQLAKENQRLRELVRRGGRGGGWGWDYMLQAATRPRLLLVLGSHHAIIAGAP